MFWEWVLKFTIGPYIKAAWDFFVANFKYFVLLFVIALVFYAGVLYQKQETVKQLTTMKEHYEKAERDRAEAIDARIAKVEKDSEDAVKKANQDKKAAEDRADQTEAKFNTILKERQKKLADAEAKLAALKAAGKKDTDQEVIDANNQITQLKMTYTLSSDAVNTINQYVKDYQ